MSTFRDVVVLLPGITGSALENTQGKEVWGTSAGVLWRAVSSFGGSIEGLELPAGGDPGGVTAPRLVQDLTILPGLIKIDGYTRIERYLVSQLELSPGENYFPFPYDWRLDNRVHARRLERQAMDWLRAWRESSGQPDARLVLIGHSMGGLVARYFLECLGGWAHTRALITLGTPHQGSLNAVDFLVHGMKKGIGPFGLDLSPLLRSYPSVYQLLPIYRCIESGAGELSKVAEAAASGLLPPVNPDWARQARAFHQEIEDAQKANARLADYREHGYLLVPLVGIEQPTYQSAKAAGGTVELLRNLDGKDDGGDGTVPRVSATPIELERQDREVFAADMHGSLQNGEGTLANLKGILKKPSIDLSHYRGEVKRLRAELPTTLTLDIDDVVLPGEPLRVRARAGEGNPRIEVLLTGIASGETIRESLARSRERGWQELEFDLAPGTWRVQVNAAGAASVTDLAVVAAP
jgi:pimeloyl-ACP methyl ester carboxylesterase